MEWFGCNNAILEVKGDVGELGCSTASAKEQTQAMFNLLVQMLA